MTTKALFSTAGSAFALFRSREAKGSQPDSLRASIEYLWVVALATTYTKQNQFGFSR
jgi:hypothetical protein